MATDLQLDTKTVLPSSKMDRIASCFYKEGYFAFIKLRLKM
jgi:hypothetical protein